MTCFLIASKHDELDENIPLIKDLTRYYCRVLPTSVSTPTFDEIVECERSLMNFFRWDLMFVTPTIIVNSMLANGIIFDNEEIEREMLEEVARKVTDRVSFNLDVLVREQYLFRDKKSSQLASVIVYLARKEEFSLMKTSPDSWTHELQIITNYSELDLIEISEKLRVKC